METHISLNITKKNEVTNSLTLIPKTKKWFLQQLNNNIIKNNIKQMNTVERNISIQKNNKDNKNKKNDKENKINKNIININTFNKKESIKLSGQTLFIEDIEQKDITEPFSHPTNNKKKNIINKKKFR